MKFELTRNYKLAFRLLNEGVILAAWLDWNRNREISKVRKIHGAIMLNIGAYLPTVYDKFEAQCQQFNIEFLISEDAMDQDLRDRSRNSPRKSLHELRKLMGTEKRAIANDKAFDADLWNQNKDWIKEAISEKGIAIPDDF